jgi:hypothetical protein
MVMQSMPSCPCGQVLFPDHPCLCLLMSPAEHNRHGKIQLRWKHLDSFASASNGDVEGHQMLT